MSFLVLLLALWVEKFSAGRQRIQQDGFWLGRLAAVQAHSGLANAPVAALALLVLLPVLLLGLLLLAIKPLAYGWLLLPVHLLVLVYSLGRGDVLATLGPFRDAWRRGDAEAAALSAERDLHIDAETEQELLVKAQGYLLWQGFQGFFAVIFWYALLGPLLALAYRLLALTAEHAAGSVLGERAQQLRHALDWLPVRVLAASFSLVGNFLAVNRVMLHELLNWEVSAPRLVRDAGVAAGDIETAVMGPEGVGTLDALWQLLIRSAMLWYAGFALLAVLFRG